MTTVDSGAVTAKLGVTTEQFNALYGAVDTGWDATAVELDLRQRFGLDAGEPIGQALLAQGVLTEGEAAYVDDD